MKIKTADLMIKTLRLFNIHNCRINDKKRLVMISKQS